MPDSAMPTDEEIEVVKAAWGHPDRNREAQVVIAAARSPHHLYGPNVEDIMQTVRARAAIISLDKHRRGE